MKRGFRTACGHTWEFLWPILLGLGLGALLWGVWMVWPLIGG